MIRYHVNQQKEVICNIAIKRHYYLLIKQLGTTYSVANFNCSAYSNSAISITHKQCSENDFLFNNFSTLFTKFLPNSQNTINLSEFADFGQN